MIVGRLNLFARAEILVFQGVHVVVDAPAKSAYSTSTDFYAFNACLERK
jgi:hypothetical protein